MRVFVLFYCFCFCFCTVVPHHYEDPPVTEDDVPTFSEVERIPFTDKSGINKAFNLETPVVVEGIIETGFLNISAFDMEVKNGKRFHLL